MSETKEKQAELRVGADFGPGHTGVALLDGENRVLARAVVVHRDDVSDALKTRRENRAMRRRVQSKRRRLRDFRALLAEMKIAPQFRDPDDREKGEDGREKFKRRVQAVGNRLYDLAHRRGWDYAELEELLVVRPEGKPPRETDLVREADDFLKKHVPPGRLTPDPDPPKRGRNSQAAHAKRLRQWESARENLESGKRPPDDSLRFVRLRETCLGELAEAEKDARKNPDEPERQARAEKIRRQLCKREDILRWLDERLRAAYGGELPHESELAPVRDNLLVRLGLKDGKDAFERGEIYAPGRNRHRDEMLRELKKLLAEAESENAAGASPAQWRRWKKRARAVLNRPYRPKRFHNRNPGKCAAQTPAGERCGKNLPQRGKVRELLLDIEALQMRVVDAMGDGEIRNLRPDELAELKECVNFRKGEIRDPQGWKNFLFRRFPPPKKKDDGEDDDETQTKRAQLRAIAEGPGAGRVRALCRECMKEKIRLLRIPENDRDEPWRGRWNALNDETVFGPNDAPPSLRQKVDIVCDRVRRMLESVRAEFPEFQNAEVVHIGVERAAFDISAMSSAGGKRPAKKSAYQKPRPRDRDALAAEQDGLCIYCDGRLGLNCTVDHVGAKRRGGGDSALNRVVMCAGCNILKGKKIVNTLAPKAMAALRQNNPDKADFLKKNLGKILANLSAPQATMFGAKVLRGALARTIFGDAGRAKDFPVIRAADTVLLRRRWFPRIHRMKDALRKKPDDGFVLVEAGHDREMSKTNLDPDAPWVPRFVRQVGEGENAKIVISPDEGDEGAWRVPVVGEDGEKLDLRIAVQPPKDSPVREYHHAVDAIAAAAAVDWEKIARLERDARDRKPRDRDIFWRQAESGRPVGDLAADAVPQDRTDWLFKNKKDKSGPKRARTKRQPLRRVRASRTDGRKFLVHRKPLHELKRDEIRRVVDSAGKIRDALRGAWEDIRKMGKEDRDRFTTDREAKIAPAYFLALPRDHILHPHKTRSVSIRYGEKDGKRAEIAFPVRSARTPDGLAHAHFFEPETPSWTEVAVWREKGRAVASRRRAAFYIRPENRRGDGDFPEWENDRPPPPDARRLRRGDQIPWPPRPGLWRINALDDRSAVVAPADDAAREFNQAEPAAVRIDGLFWAGLLVARRDDFAPDGEDQGRADIPGLWTMQKLRGRAVLAPADPAARDAAEKGASAFARYQDLQPQPASPPAGAQVRRLGKFNGRAGQLWPGIWRIAPSQENAKRGQALVVPDDASARRAAKTAEKKASYSALIPA